MFQISFKRIFGKSCTANKTAVLKVRNISLTLDFFMCLSLKHIRWHTLFFLLICPSLCLNFRVRTKEASRFLLFNVLSVYVPSVQYQSDLEASSIFCFYLYICCQWCGVFAVLCWAFMKDTQLVVCERCFPSTCLANDAEPNYRAVMIDCWMYQWNIARITSIQPLIPL